MTQGQPTCSWPLNSADDVYCRLVEQSDKSWILGLVAFSIIEEMRIDWMKHVATIQNRQPNPTEVRDWYRQLSQNQIQRAEADAENALKVFADEALQEVLEAERRDVADGVIVGEIRLARRFWPQFGINVAGGFASAMLFAAILVILALYVWVDPSPVKMGRNAHSPNSSEVTNGETRSEQGSN